MSKRIFAAGQQQFWRTTLRFKGPKLRLSTPRIALTLPQFFQPFSSSRTQNSKGSGSRLSSPQIAFSSLFPSPPSPPPPPSFSLTSTAFSRKIPDRHPHNSQGLARLMSTMAKPKVMFLGIIEHAFKEWDTVAQIAEIIVPKSTDRAGFLAECKAGYYDGVVATYRTFESISITGRFDEELIKHLPTSLKYICHNGAGYDQVEIGPCTARGIRVSNVPTAVDDATADVNMFLILGALRNFSIGMSALRRLEWRGNAILGHDPQGKVLGILGMGGIGRNLKKKAEAFGMKIQYHNRKRLSAALEGGAKYVSFDELLATSDVISLNLPLNAQTRHIISAREFEKMKDGVVIVNTARGAVIDEGALVDALNRGKVRSCGLDVFENEPVIHPGLLANPDVLLIPHMGTFTVETQTKMECWNIENLLQALKTGTLKSPVN